MKNTFVKLTLVTAILSASSTSVLAGSDKLPSAIAGALKSAYSTQNINVINPVKAQLKADNPAFSKDIDSYAKVLKKAKWKRSDYKCDKKNKKNNKQIASIPTLTAHKEDKNWKGSLEGGLAIATGNTETEKLNFSGKLINSFGQWENILIGKADGSKENQIRNSEEYKVNNQTRYNLTDVDYIFGELEYVNDRFSGYDRRTSELLGYGRKIINKDDMKLSGEVSVGARQSKLTSGVKEDTVLGKVAGKFEWDINEFVTFNQNLSAAIGEDSTITNSETSIKTKLSDKLYLKAGVDVEHISDVPVGVENTDTVTKVTIGYDF